MNGRELQFPPATMVVERLDGRIETDSETDAYALLVARARGAVKQLGEIKPGQLHSRQVIGLVTETPGIRPGGLETKTTLVMPTDPQLGGALLFAGLLKMREHSPGAFAEAMRRLRDAGLTGGG